MKSRRVQLHLSLGGFVALVFFPWPAVADGDSGLPGNGFPASRYEALWSKSPFAVASADGSGPESPDYALVGIAEFDGISYASIIDKKSQNQEHILLSSEKDADGLKLVSVARGKDAESTTAVVLKNGESLPLKLDPSAGSPAPGMTPVPAPVITMPGAVPAQTPVQPPASTGQPPPVTYRPHMITLPSPPPTRPASP
jgi:hypothetical protein